MWKECQKKGKDSAFWKEHHCERRSGAKVDKYSKWWWWTESGREMWRKCRKEGEKSAFWKENHCGRAR